MSINNKSQTFFKYFPCNESLIAGGMYVLSCGWSKVPPYAPYPPAIHPDDHNFAWNKGRVLDSYTFVYVPSGKGVLETQNHNIYKIKGGEVFVIFPSQWHRYKPDDNCGWDEYWIELGGGSAKKFVSASGINPSEPVIKINKSSNILADIFADVIETAEKEPYGSEYFLCAYALNILALIISESASDAFEDNEKYETIRKAKRLLLEDVAKPLDLPMMALELGMSYSLFRKTFKEITGFTPHQYRLNYRLHRASRMLRFSNVQVGQIANRLGFSSIYYFSELFKKKTGFSPKAFRDVEN